MDARRTGNRAAGGAGMTVGIRTIDGGGQAATHEVAPPIAWRALPCGREEPQPSSERTAFALPTRLAAGRQRRVHHWKPFAKMRSLSNGSDQTPRPSVPATSRPWVAM
jgi:hypothetical protein